jgi:hypothetical protein
MNVSRRIFLSRSSIGIALAGAIALVPGLSAIFKLPAHPVAFGPQLATAEPLVAHVRDLTSGEISLMFGTTQVIRRDVELAARLYAAARQSP